MLGWPSPLQVPLPRNDLDGVPAAQGADDVPLHASDAEEEEDDCMEGVGTWGSGDSPSPVAAKKGLSSSSSSKIRRTGGRGGEFLALRNELPLAVSALVDVPLVDPKRFNEAAFNAALEAGASEATAIAAALADTAADFDDDVAYSHAFPLAIHAVPSAQQVRRSEGGGGLQWVASNSSPPFLPPPDGPHPEGGAYPQRLLRRARCPRPVQAPVAPLAHQTRGAAPEASAPRPPAVADAPAGEAAAADDREPRPHPLRDARPHPPVCVGPRKAAQKAFARAQCAGAAGRLAAARARIPGSRGSAAAAVPA